MSRNRSFRPPINPKNRMYCHVDSQKMRAQRGERIGRYGPKWHVDVRVGRYISGTPPITQTQLGLMGLVIVAAVASGGIGGDITSIAEAPATEFHVVKDLCRDCDADTLIDVILSDNGVDVSANQYFSGTVVAISQRTGQWIRNGAKNVVRQQMPRSMRELSLDWKRYSALSWDGQKRTARK